MTAADEFQELASQIERDIPGARARVMPFSSGAVMMDVHVGGRMFVAAYGKSWGYGVDEAHDEDGIGTWYTYCYPDFESARRKLVSLVEAAVGHPQQA